LESQRRISRPKPRIVLTIFLAFFLAPLMPAPTFAACGSPAGNAGDLMYNQSSHVMQFCDSALWRQIGATGAGQVITTNVNPYNIISPDVVSLADNTSITSGLVGWWKLDDASSGNAVTTAADSSGNGHTGATQGTTKPTWTSSGKINDALILAAASNQYVSVPDVASLDIAGAWTVSAWVKLTTLPTSGTGQSLLARVTTTGPDENYALYVDDGYFTGAASPSFDAHFSYSGGTNVDAVYTPPVSSPISTGTWYHLVGTWDGTTLTLYVNGVPVASYQPGHAPNGGAGATGLYIGGEVGSGNYLKGTVDDVRLYNRALLPAEITQLDLLGWWMLDDASSGDALTTATDSSGYGYTGTLEFWNGTTDVTCTAGTNCATWTSSGKIGRALTFNGSTQEVDVASIAGITNTFTVAFWEKTSVTTGQVLWAMGGSADCKVDFSGHDIACTVQGNTAPTVAATAIDDGNWHFIAYVVNNTAQTLYVDGMSQATGSETPTGFPNTSCFGGGKCWGTLSWFNGTMDDARVYDRALSAGEINQIYTHSNPVGWWKFDEGTGTTAADSSGNGNTMADPGTLTWATGILGGAVSIPGTTTNDMETVNGDATVFDGSSSWTASAWVNVNVLPGSQQSTIINHYAEANNATETPAWSLAIDNGWNNCLSPQFLFYGSQFDGSGSWSGAGCVGSISLHTWYLVTGEYDNSTGTFYLYVNGALVNTGPANGAGFMAYAPCTTAGDCPVSVGSNANNNNLFFNGLVDDARVYNRLLSAAEVLALYNAGNGIPAGLVGWWKLDDASSGTSPATAADSSGNGNNGTNTATPTWTGSGKIGSALTLNGTTQDVSVPDVASLRLAGSWTVSGWINMPSLPPSGDRYTLVSKNDASSNENYEILVDNQSNSNMFGVTGPSFVVHFATSGGVDKFATYTAPINTGTWYLVTGTWDGTTLTLYVNGASVATNVPGAVPASASGQALLIGYDNTGSAQPYWAHGTIDDVRVYSRALSAAEVGQLYGGSYCGPPSGLVAWFKFDDGAGTTAADSSPTNQSANCNAGGGGLGWTTSGEINGAGTFTAAGANQRCATVDAQTNQTGSFTVAGWVKFTILSGVFDSLISNASGGGSNQWAFGGVNSAGHDVVQFLVSNTGAVFSINRIGTTALTAGNWYHLAGVYDASAQTLHVYVNGVLDDGTLTGVVPASLFNNSGQGRMAYDSPSSKYLDGTLDDTRDIPSPRWILRVNSAAAL